MIEAKIFVNGMGYCGESSEQTYQANVGGEGWYVHNHGSLDVLVFSDDTAQVLQGNRALRSAIDKILRRVDHGQLTIHEIKIVIREQGGCDENERSRSRID